MTTGLREASMDLPDLAMALPPERAAQMAETICLMSTYLHIGEWEIDGDLALRHHALQRGRVHSERNYEKLAVTVSGRESLMPEVSERFLVAHHHYSGEPDDFFLQLVSPDTQVTTAVELQIADGGIVQTRLRGLEIPLNTPEAMLVDRARKIRAVLGGMAVDAKLFADANALELVARHAPAEALWQSLQAQSGDSLSQTLYNSRLAARANTRLAVELPPYIPWAGTDCANCLDSDTGSLPPTDRPEEVYRIWGEVLYRSWGKA